MALANFRQLAQTSCKLMRKKMKIFLYPLCDRRWQQAEIYTMSSGTTNSTFDVWRWAWPSRCALYVKTLMTGWIETSLSGARQAKRPGNLNQKLNNLTIGDHSPMSSAGCFHFRWLFYRRILRFKLTPFHFLMYQLFRSAVVANRP